MTTATTPASVVVIGGGIGGLTVARELRRLGFGGEVTIIDPQGEPYDRPPLSKQYLAGEWDPARLAIVEPEWYAEADISVVTDRADRLLATEGAVVLDGGARLRADTVVLATGGVPRRLAVPGGSKLLTLRTRDDADVLREHLGPGTRLAIIGAGLIGAEVASTARRLGGDVVLVDPAPVPLVPAVGPDLAGVLHAMHTAAGIETVVGAPSAVRDTGSGLLLELDCGPAAGRRVVEVDAALVAIGLEPDLALAGSGALEVAGGVLVDRHQLSSNPAVFAVGDTARTRLSRGLLSRHGHWESAMHGAQRAAAAIVGAAPPAHGAPWFWSDRHGVHVEVVGSMTAPGRDVLRVVDGTARMAFRLTDEGFVAGCAAIDGGIGVRAARRMIDRHIAVDVAQLADPGVPLRQLAR